MAEQSKYQPQAGGETLAGIAYALGADAQALARLRGTAFQGDEAVAAMLEETGSRLQAMAGRILAIAEAGPAEAPATEVAGSGILDKPISGLGKKRSAAESPIMVHPRFPGGNCAGLEWDEMNPKHGLMTAEAGDACDGCDPEVRRRCAAYALQYGAPGIWGGLSEEDRRQRLNLEIEIVVSPKDFVPGMAPPGHDVIVVVDPDAPTDEERWQEKNRRKACLPDDEVEIEDLEDDELTDEEFEYEEESDFADDETVAAEDGTAERAALPEGGGTRRVA